jgi:hypothetical protein
MTLLEVLAAVTDLEEPATVEVNPVMLEAGRTLSLKEMTAVSPSEGIIIEETVGADSSGTGTVLLFVTSVEKSAKALEEESVTFPEE